MKAPKSTDFRIKILSFSKAYNNMSSDINICVAQINPTVGDIEGLPFPASGSNYHGGGFIGYAGVMNYGYPLLHLVVQGQAIGYFHRQDGTNNTWKYSDMHNVGNGSSGQLIVTFIYETGT